MRLASTPKLTIRASRFIMAMTACCCLALPSAAYTPIKKEQEGRDNERKTVRIASDVLRELLGDATQPQANEFRTVSYPFPDGLHRQITLRSFVLWDPKTARVIGGRQSDEIHENAPVVQWLGVIPNEERPDLADAIAIHIHRGKFAGHAIFAGRLYKQEIDAESDQITYFVNNSFRPPVDFRDYTLSSASLFGQGTYALLGDDAVVDVAVVTDHAMFDVDFGGDFTALVDAVLETLAEVNIIYYRDLHVLLNMTALLMHVQPSPYDFAFMAAQRATNLNLFGNEFRTLFPTVQRDVAALFTHYTIDGIADGQSVGVGTLCDPDTAYIAIRYDADRDSFVRRTAHEIGHSLGANHTNCTPDPNSPLGFVDGCAVQFAGTGLCYEGPEMTPAIPTIMSLCGTPDLSFHPVIQSVVENQLAGKTCIEPAYLSMLQNGVTETFSTTVGPIATGNARYFAIDVPDVLEFEIVTSGGTGDADLFAQRRTLNTLASWPSTNVGNTETVSFFNPADSRFLLPPCQSRDCTTRWYIRVAPKAASPATTGQFSGVGLTASYVPCLSLTPERRNQRVDAGDRACYSVDVSPGAQSLTLTAESINGGGAFEVFVGQTAHPDVRNANAPNNVGHIANADLTKTYTITQGQQPPVEGRWYLAVTAAADIRLNVRSTVTF